MYEMIFVMFIVGLFARAAVTRFSSSLQVTRANAAAKRIVSDLSAAQARARMTSGSQSVVFTVAPTGNQYQLTNLTDPDHSHGTYAVDLSAAPYYGIVYSASLGGDSTIIFNGYGIPDSGGTIQIKFGQLLKTITVNSDTGEATIQ